MAGVTRTTSLRVRRKPEERGASILLLTFLMTFVLIPLVGLGIDGSVIFWTKAKLSAAVDAAALATARNFSTTVGQSYFTADFPSGFLGTTISAGYPVITLTESPIHVWVGTVTASVSLPLYFMRILNHQVYVVADTGQATRHDVNIMMVLDRSNSMNTSPEPPNNLSACQAMAADAQLFLALFVPTHDDVGLITFQTGANLDYSPSVNFNTSNPPSSSLPLNQTLASLVCAGDTSSAQGLSMAYGAPPVTTTGITQMSTARPNALNVILFFTDGEPNGINATFKIKTATDSRYGTGWTLSTPPPDQPNMGSIYSDVKSGCKSTDVLSGIIADGSQETATTITGLNPTGYTVAVLSAAGVPITNSSNPTTISASGCAFPNSSNWQQSMNGRLDIAYIPTTDNYGNSTVGSEFGTLDLFTSGTYKGDIRPDMPRTARYVSFNAADSIAHTIRNAGSTLIYTIGLSGNETMAIDDQFMERLANDPRADDYNPLKPTGMYILATNQDQLANAFLEVASQILHLTE